MARRAFAWSGCEAERLLAELPEHLVDMAAFSLATGLRAANVTGLQWQQVALTRQLAWIHPDQAKARTGDYKIVKRGTKVTRARCLEGGYVMVPSQGKATTAQRDHDIHEACKTVDYTK